MWIQEASREGPPGGLGVGWMVWLRQERGLSGRVGPRAGDRTTCGQTRKCDKQNVPFVSPGCSRNVRLPAGPLLFPSGLLCGVELGPLLPSTPSLKREQVPWRKMSGAESGVWWPKTTPG